MGFETCTMPQRRNNSETFDRRKLCVSRHRGRDAGKSGAKDARLTGVKVRRRALTVVKGVGTLRKSMREARQFKCGAAKDAFGTSLR